MDEITKALRRQVGPFAVWQWLAIVAGGVALGLAMRRYFGGDDAPPTAPTGTRDIDPVTGLSYGAAAIGPGQGGTVGPDYAPPPPPAPPEPADADDGDDWLARASRAVQGQADALVIDTALRKYLEGAPLNAAEMAVVSAAIGAVGAPPNAPYAIAEATVPAAPAPKPSGGGSGGSTPARRKPLTGWDLVRDNLDAVFVVQWSSETRYRVQPRDLDRAREIFGSPLTRASQIPGDARNAQRGLLEQIEREEGDRLPSGRIYLDARMGWREAGTWAPTIGTTR